MNRLFSITQQRMGDRAPLHYLIRLLWISGGSLLGLIGWMQAVAATDVEPIASVDVPDTAQNSPDVPLAAATLPALSEAASVEAAAGTSRGDTAMAGGGTTYSAPKSSSGVKPLPPNGVASLQEPGGLTVTPQAVVDAAASEDRAAPSLVDSPETSETLPEDAIAETSALDDSSSLSDAVSADATDGSVSSPEDISEETGSERSRQPLAAASAGGNVGPSTEFEDEWEAVEQSAVQPVHPTPESSPVTPEDDAIATSPTPTSLELYDDSFNQALAFAQEWEAAERSIVFSVEEYDKHFNQALKDRLRAQMGHPDGDSAITQVPDSAAEEADPAPLNENVDAVEPASELSEPIEAYQPLLQFQAASIFQEDELSGRLRATGLYAFSDQVLVGATVDLIGGEAFVDSEDEGLSLNELYVSAAPFRDLPNLRVVGGLIDLTSYFDRNSFAKDVVTHFINPAFQTNPALSAAGLSSRPGVLVNWNVTDQIELKAAGFSSSRNLGDLALDGFAAEAGFRTGNLIVRGTFSTARDADDDTGFEEIFQIRRNDGDFGLSDDDREVAYGLNAEYFIDSINVGLFGRYGWYSNEDVDRGASTFSVGANALGVFLPGDRLGLGYGQQLSNSDLRDDETPTVLEIFYDAPVYSTVRLGVSLQSRDEFTDTGLAFRVRADW